jgi:monoamine oxidase
MKSKHCLVIGAGLAGLAAAHRLLQHGWSVEVLEADKDRLGGRVFTQRVRRKGKEDLVYELGGEWIGTTHKRVIQLCNHFQLRRMRHRYSFAFMEEGIRSRFYKPGKLPFSKSENAAFKNFQKSARKMDACEEKELDRMDWWTKVAQLGFSKKSLLRRDLMDSTDFGESIRHTSGFVGATEYTAGNRYDEMDEKIVGGNDRLIYKLAGAVNRGKERIHLGCDVSQIRQGKGGVTVVTRSKRKFSCDACICAIPASRLHHIRWHPALPAEQLSAARQLQYARIVKTAFQFPKKFWPYSKDKNAGFSLFTSRASDFCFESTFRQEGPEGIICSYAIGDKADDLADERGDRLAEWLSADLAIALGIETIQGKFLQRKSWQGDKRIGGAYAFYRPGQWFHVRPALQRPHQRVSFAGEHLSEAWQGFMEGAIQTGEAAADAL